MNGQTDIEGRCACLHVVDEEAAESLRRKVGDGRLNCKPGALPRNSLPRPAGFFIPGITLVAATLDAAIRWTSGRVFGMTKQSRPGLPASDIRFLRRVLALMTERVPLEAMDKVRVRDVLGRQELQELRAVDRASDHARQ